MAKPGKIFARYKALGYVSNDVPLVTRYIRRRKENLVVTVVGRSFHTYGCSHFALLSVSGQHDEDIACLASDFFHIYTGAGNKVYAWRRGSELKHTYNGHSKPVHLILPFGPNLLTVDDDSRLIIWDIKTEENLVDWEFQNDKFQITSIMHPSTYLNKVLIGSDQGLMNLINIQSQSVIYTFKGWGHGVTVLAQAPAIDVVGVGLKSGDIILHNLKYDESVMKFHQDWGPVTALSFRTDSPLMVSGAINGRIVMWDLEEGKVFAQLTAHTAAVTGLQCLSSEPLMLSSSPDNSLKMWIFDKADGGARLLRIREGHSAPPSYIRFHGANGHNILSGGGDSTLRIFNTITETFNKSLGRASYNRKASKKKGKFVDDYLIMPPIVRFTSETTREKEWDSIAATHLGSADVTTWSYGKLKMGEMRLRHERFIPKKNYGRCVQATPSSICLTHCGNFVVIGYSSGHCDRYNIQSGMHRGSYGDPAHKGAIRGLSTDSLNQTVITGGADTIVRWWHFSKYKLLTSLELDHGVTFIIHHQESGLLGVALEDYSLNILDESERTVLRKFPGHNAQITDAAFSTDGRWLISSGMDKLICTWDIPSGCLVDRFKVDAACSSLALSPTGEILATTHVDCLGVYLWQNRTLYSHVTLRPISNEDIPEVSLPTGEQEETIGEDEDESEEPIEQIEHFATLSGLPPSRWLNLLNIDIIRQRNRPKDAPKAPAAAPFFLPTVPALDIRFDLSVETEKDQGISKDLTTTTPFAKMLKSTAESGDFQKVIDKLKSMGPTAINFEVTSLSDNDPEPLKQFIEMICVMLKSGRDMELAHAYLGVFLKAHGTTIVNNPHLRGTVAKMQEAQTQAWRRLEKKLFYNLAVVQGIKNL